MKKMNDTKMMSRSQTKKYCNQQIKRMMRWLKIYEEEKMLQSKELKKIAGRSCKKESDIAPIESADDFNQSRYR